MADEFLIQIKHPDKENLIFPIDEGFGPNNALLTTEAIALACRYAYENHNFDNFDLMKSKITAAYKSHSIESEIIISIGHNGAVVANLRKHDEAPKGKNEPPVVLKEVDGVLIPSIEPRYKYYYVMFYKLLGQGPHDIIDTEGRDEWVLDEPITRYEQLTEREEERLVTAKQQDPSICDITITNYKLLRKEEIK